MNQASLYFHIPFCTKKCPYCHFYVLKDNHALRKKFLDSLQKEWIRKLPLLKNAEIVSIYFGGGTPALLTPFEIQQILSPVLNELSVASDCEITLEANPENLDEEKLQGFISNRINRLSMGVQSFDANLLQVLGRIHDSNKALWAIESASKIGFKNISIDLMYDLPNQTLDEFKRTLAIATQLPISHLSLYNLQIEPHTSFYKKQNELKSLLPSDELSISLLKTAIGHLTNNGFEQYEISAFAKDKKFSRHNLGYWQARPFLGLGPSAFSFWHKARFRNIAHLGKYATLLDNNQDPVDFSEKLTDENSQKELLAIELRLLRGVNLVEFEQKHGLLSCELASSIELLKEKNLLSQEEAVLKLTPQGLIFYDTVAIELV